MSDDKNKKKDLATEGLKDRVKGAGNVVGGPGARARSAAPGAIRASR